MRKVDTPVLLVSLALLVPGALALWAGLRLKGPCPDLSSASVSTDGADPCRDDWSTWPADDVVFTAVGALLVLVALAGLWWATRPATSREAPTRG